MTISEISRAFNVSLLTLLFSYLLIFFLFANYLLFLPS